MGAPTTRPVDLLALRRACRPIIRCYERFLSEGHLKVHDLDEALTSLRALPRVGGRLGHAVALLVAGGAGAPSEETLAALELLRTTSGLRLAEAQATSAPRRPSTGTEAAPVRWSQPPLPGLD